MDAIVILEHSSPEERRGAAVLGYSDPLATQVDRFVDTAR
jgi:hypothetical protein